MCYSDAIDCPTKSRQLLYYIQIYASVDEDLKPLM